MTAAKDELTPYALIACDRDQPAIVIASILRPAGSTGVHTHVDQLARYLRSRRSDPVLVTPFSWGGPLRYPAFGARLPIQRVSPGASVLWYRRGHEEFLHRALSRELRRNPYSVVYAQGPVEASAALRARRTPQQRVVMVAHYYRSQADEWAMKGQIPVDGATFRAIRRFERRVISQVDGLVVVSRAARDSILEWFPQVAAIPTAVIPNFVHASPTTAHGPALADLVSVGGLELAKNHFYLLEILAAANRRGVRLSADVYGEGPCRRALESRAGELGVAGQVRFLGYRSDVRSRLPRYRVYVHTARLESLPIAVLEAMAAGLPVVCTPAGGTTELFEDGTEGLLWPLGDADRAAGTLIDLMSSPEALDALGAAAQQRFRACLSADVVAPALESFILGAAPLAPVESFEPSGLRG